MAAQLKKISEVSLYDESQSVSHNIYYATVIKIRLFHQTQNDSRLCPISRDVIYFLLTKPIDWIVRQAKIQIEKKFGERVWRRISRILREVGLLELKKGGNNVKQGYLRFNPFGYKPLQETTTTFSKATESANSITTIGHSINNINNINNINKTTNTRARSIREKDPMEYKDTLPANDPVVVFFKKYKNGMAELPKLLQQFGCDYLKSKILAFQDFFSSGRCHNPIAFLKSALRGNWMPSAKKKRTDLADRKQELENLEIIKNKTEGASSRENAEIWLIQSKNILGKKTVRELTHEEKLNVQRDMAHCIEQISMEGRGEVFYLNQQNPQGNHKKPNGDKNLCIERNDLTKGKENNLPLVELSEN